MALINALPNISPLEVAQGKFNPQAIGAQNIGADLIQGGMDAIGKYKMMQMAANPNAGTPYDYYSKMADAMRFIDPAKAVEFRAKAQQAKNVMDAQQGAPNAAAAITGAGLSNMGWDAKAGADLAQTGTQMGLTTQKSGQDMLPQVAAEFRGITPVGEDWSTVQPQWSQARSKWLSKFPSLATYFEQQIPAQASQEAWDTVMGMGGLGAAVAPKPGTQQAYMDQAARLTKQSQDINDNYQSMLTNPAITQEEREKYYNTTVVPAQNAIPTNYQEYLSKGFDNKVLLQPITTAPSNVSEYYDMVPGLVKASYKLKAGVDPAKIPQNVKSFVDTTNLEASSANATEVTNQKGRVADAIRSNTSASDYIRDAQGAQGTIASAVQVINNTKPLDQAQIAAYQKAMGIDASNVNSGWARMLAGRLNLDLTKTGLSEQQLRQAAQAIVKINQGLANRRSSLLTTIPSSIKSQLSGVSLNDIKSVLDTELPVVGAISPAKVDEKKKTPLPAPEDPKTPPPKKLY